MAAIEPLAGKRVADVYDHRTKKEYTQFMQTPAQNYTQAKKIIRGQDNLNTHNISSFYEHPAADQAKSLADRFGFHYTPKSASGLPVTEIELSALSKAVPQPKNWNQRKTGTANQVHCKRKKRQAYKNQLAALYINRKSND